LADSAHSLDGLIGCIPDPERDRAALLRAESGAPELARLAKRLHTDERWRKIPLGTLLPGLSSIEGSGTPFPPALNARAANCLLRAKVTNWDALVGWTPADIGDLRGLGANTLEEVLRVTLQEWAGFHLRDPAEINPAEIHDGLLALSAWGESARGTRGAVAAIAAAGEAHERLPPRVARAMRTLRRIGGSEGQARFGLEHAFVELEKTPGFTVFRQRRLARSARRATYRELAAELGVTRSRIGQLGASFERELELQMREPDWPIRLAAEQLRERLGAVARSEELDGVFSDLDPNQVLEPRVHPHRRELLLWLCDFRVGDEWILGPDIEALTDIVLAAVADREHADLDAASRHLAQLGVREEMQLRWIVSRTGFRIVDGRIVPS